jgi:hypothetical protein
MVAVARPRILVVIPMLAALALGLSGPFGAQSGGGAIGTGAFTGIPLLALLGAGVAVIGVGLAVLAGERRRRRLPAA